MNSLRLTLLCTLSMALVSCGGAKKNEGGTPGVGHSNSSGGTGDGTDDVDSPLSSTVADAGLPDALPPAPVTFVIKNNADEDLVLNMDKGWQPIIFAYSGKPPNAKSILMFPTYCTASCDASPEEVCPYCPEPEKVKDIKAAENHDHVAPGDMREVPWDGLAFEYKRTKGTQNGKRARCKCSNTVEAPPETYTVKACGLRFTKTAKATSKYQCVESTMTLPVTEPIRVELDFGKAKG